MTTIAEKRLIVAEMSNADLLTYHDDMVRNFNPVDDDFLTNFCLVTDEILRRMGT